MRARSCRRRAVRGLGIGISLALCASAANAEDIAPAVELDWTAPGDCPPRSAVLERVQQLVATDAATSPSLAARAEVTKHDRTYHLTVTLRVDDLEETRAAQSQTCTALGETAAIILATAIDAARHARSSAVPREPEPSTTREHEPTPIVPHAPRAGRQIGPDAGTRSTDGTGGRATPSRVVAGFGVASMFDFGTLPRPAGGLEAAAHLKLERWLFAVAGSLWVPRTQSFASRTSGGAHFEGRTIGLSACWTPFGANVRIGACGGLDMMDVDVSGFGIRRPAAGTIRWPTIRLGAIAESRVGPNATMFIRTDAAFAFAVPRIVLSTDASNLTLHEVGVPAVRVTMGMRIDLFSIFSHNKVASSR